MFFDLRFIIFIVTLEFLRILALVIFFFSFPLPLLFHFLFFPHFPFFSFLIFLLFSPNLHHFLNLVCHSLERRSRAPALSAALPPPFKVRGLQMTMNFSFV